MVWAHPVSLAATQGIARTFFLNVMVLAHHRPKLLLDEMRSIRPERKFRILLSFPPATVMFHFAGYAPTYMGTCWKAGEFPHSDIVGYNDCLASPPRLTQPYHVLHRFLKPRHPPYTLHSHRECCTPLYNFWSLISFDTSELCLWFVCIQRTKRPVHCCNLS